MPISSSDIGQNNIFIYNQKIPNSVKQRKECGIQTRELGVSFSISPQAGRFG
jgi:hypothetical protein